MKKVKKVSRYFFVTVTSLSFFFFKAKSNQEGELVSR